MRNGLLQKLDFILITNRNICEVELTKTVGYSIEGGVGTIQLREKDLSARELYVLARKLREITKYLNANLIINDRVDIAMAIGADGVHLGWQSLDINTVRKIIGQEKLIGFSAHNLQDAKNAEYEGADYATISPIFDTPYKDYFIKPIGASEIKKIKDQIKIPVIALGGINENNVREVLSCGADGIAVISAVLTSKYPEKIANILYSEVKKFKPKTGNRKQNINWREGMQLLKNIKFNDKGLIPSVIVDMTDNKVLTLCYMNQAALEKTLETGKVHVFRRSKNRLMIKGETSGHIQLVKEVYFDCEGNSLVIKVDQKVAACHAGYKTCYYRKYNTGTDSIEISEDRVFDPDKIYKS